MDKQKRKDIVSEYMSAKKEMGVYVFECKATNKHYLGITQNTKSTLNGSKFRLGANNHSCINLQTDWNKYKEENFDVRVLEVLEYDKDDISKTDYSVELRKLLDTWCGKFESFEVIKGIF